MNAGREYVESEFFLQGLDTHVPSHKRASVRQSIKARHWRQPERFGEFLRHTRDGNELYIDTLFLGDGLNVRLMYEVSPARVTMQSLSRT